MRCRIVSGIRGAPDPLVWMPTLIHTAKQRESTKEEEFCSVMQCHRHLVALFSYPIYLQSIDYIMYKYYSASLGSWGRSRKALLLNRQTCVSMKEWVCEI